MMYGRNNLTAWNVLEHASEVVGKKRTSKATLKHALQQVAMEPELILANDDRYDGGFAVAFRMSAFCCNIVEIWVKERETRQ